MSEFGNIGDDPDVARFDPLALAEALTGGLGAGADVRSRLAGVRGRAESADGVVRVEVDQQGRLTDVQFDPKAMRLPSADLAALVVRLAKQAESDAVRQMTAVIGDPSRLTATLDPETIKNKLADVAASFRHISSTSSEQFDELQRRLRS